MKFDVVIIGGGLSGLVCGISLQRKGKRCAIVSAGQSALHFSSGYFDLLDRTPGGAEVSSPADVIESLPKQHPYRKIGREAFEHYTDEVKPFFSGCGISLKGGGAQNCYRITPMGGMRPSWLCLGEFTPFETSHDTLGGKALVVNIPGFLDFNVKFIASELEKRGTSCRIADVTTDVLNRLRSNPGEMRAANIGRAMDSNAAASEFVAQVRSRLDGEDAVVLPAVFGLKDASVPYKVAEAIGVRTEYIATMPPSVPGIRTQMRLRAAFERCGGAFMLGDTVMSSEMDGGHVKSVGTVNFGDERLYADDFILASGSFFSNGLTASKENVAEPVFGLDIDCIEDRSQWVDRSFFKKQNYMGFGVRTDEIFRTFKGGEVVDNLYAAGSVLGGFNPVAEGCGGGVSILSAMHVATQITKR